MKFAKELEQELVPEWRLKYLDYKLGKKKVKAVAKAIKDANKTTPRSRNKSLFATTSLQAAPQYSYLNRGPSSREPHASNGDLENNFERTPPPPSTSGRPLISSLKSSDRVGSRNISKKVRLPEEEPLNNGERRPGGGLKTRYGSIICSPPEDSPLAARASKDDHSDDQTLTHAPSFELPDPALDPAKRSHSYRRANDNALSKVPTHPDGDNAYNVGKTRPPPAKTKLSTRHLSIFQPKRMNSTPNDGSGRPFMRRVMSLGSTPSNMPSPSQDVPMEAFREIDVRQADFFNFLDLQLEKIENFYKQKEDEATERLRVLRDQLHIMRDRRMDEIVQARHDRIVAKRNGQSIPEENGFLHEMTKKAETHGPTTWLKTLDYAWGTAKNGRIGKASKALAGLATPEGPHPIDSHRDYVRRVTTSAVPYRAAKRKLKYALQEYYRGLELLKSFALLNRTAFRKINKKYDKAVSARPTNRYVQEKVNKAYFVQSDVLEGHIRATEDLYARYFEGGNYKIAASKLRAKSIRPEDYTASVFRNGLFLAAGLVFGVQGIVDAGELLFDPDPLLSVQTAYLCQIYGGYFLMLALVLMFCFACKFWTISKVNYVFVFEFDTRHHLDWRQLFEIPCILFFLQGFFLWMNFTRYGTDAMYLYWPVLLIGITLVILFFPAPYLYHHTRGWFLYSNWRLFFAGLYPVEFRDFFMGDMFCSQTYAMGNIELFFCLYANDWQNPTQCNSSSSRLLGFFSTLPGIWRALQCLRRYYDTRNVFPHLVNGGKYTMTILYYMSLSLYRINKTNELRALFIVFATINAVYCSVWDLAMDWSLLDPTAKHRFLRKELAYKQIWIYYAAIIIDPILRFNWIYYAIFSHDVQHSAILSFFVAFSEVARRGIWVVFRVENEHCTNVQRYRASRDLPLPYEVRENTPLLPPGTTSVDPRSPELSQAQRRRTHDSSDEEASIEGNGIKQVKDDSDAKRRPAASRTGTATSAKSTDSKKSPALQTPSRVPTASDDQDKLSRTPIVNRQSKSGGSGRKMAENSPWMRVLSRVGSIMQLAHAQDFERRRVIPGVDDGDDIQDNLLAPSGVLGNNVKPDTAEGRRRKERAGLAVVGAGQKGDHQQGGGNLSSDDDELSDEEFERLVHSDQHNIGTEGRDHDDENDANLDSQDDPVDSSDDVIADAGRTANVQAHNLLERAEKLDHEQDVRDDRELEEIEQDDDEEMARGGWKRSFERSRTAVGSGENEIADEAEASGTVRRRKKDEKKEESDDLMSPGHSD